MPTIYDYKRCALLHFHEKNLLLAATAEIALVIYTSFQFLSRVCKFLILNLIKYKNRALNLSGKHAFFSGYWQKSLSKCYWQRCDHTI